MYVLLLQLHLLFKTKISEVKVFCFVLRILYEMSACTVCRALSHFNDPVVSTPHMPTDAHFLAFVDSRIKAVESVE